MNFNTFTCKFLKAIDDSYENGDFEYAIICNPENYGISEKRLDLFIENLVNDGYIDGIVLQRDYVGKLHSDISTPRLTSHGLRVLENCKF